MLSISIPAQVFEICEPAAEFRSGVVYVYSGQISEQYTTVTWKIGHTYEVNNLLGLYSNTNQSILYFSNELIAKVDTNTTLNIVQFDQEVKNLTAPPQELKAGKHSLILNLVSGELVINSTKPPVAESSTIVSTPFGDVEITDASTVLLNVDSERLLVYSYSGTVSVYANRGSPSIVERSRSLTVFPNRFPMRGDTRKYQLSKKQPTGDDLVNLNSRIPKYDHPIRSEVLFAQINRKLVGINLR